MPDYALGKSSSNESHKKQEVLVGAWACNLLALEQETYAVVSFGADGSFIFDQALALTQTFPRRENGIFETISTGVWRKLSYHNYEGVISCVLLERGLDCELTGDYPACLALPAVPIERVKFLFNEIVIDKKGETAIANLSISFHPVNDLTLTLPTDPPRPVVSGVMQLRKVQLPHWTCH